MKNTLLCIVLLISISRPAQSQVDTTTFYEFHINYWFNAHHFLWLEAFLNVEKDSTTLSIKLPKKDRQRLDTALDYYKQFLVGQDLRMSEYMNGFKEWIITQDQELKDIPQPFLPHMNTLQAFEPVYQKYFWPLHRQTCEQVLVENVPLIRATEEKYVDQITSLTRQFWEFQKIRVDVTYTAKATKWNVRNRPYTTLFPTHVVINAWGENQTAGNWIELLYHESAHHLILPGSYYVSGTINDWAETHDTKPPRQLWHAYLFYFTGQLTKSLLMEQGIDYPATYMERNGVFSRYFPVLEKHLTSYMKREATLAEVTSLIIETLNNP